MIDVLFPLPLLFLPQVSISGEGLVEEETQLIVVAEPPWLADIATEYLAAIAADDSDRLTGVIEMSYEPAVLADLGLAGWVNQHLTIARQLEGFDRYHVAHVDPDELEVLTRHAPDGEWLSWRFQREEGSEFLRGIRVANAAEPELWAPDYSGLSTAEIAAKLRAALNSPALGLGVARVDGPNEAVVVGVRRSDGRVRAQIGDTFHLGSCTKTATAMLVAQVVGKGKLTWESTLDELLGDDFAMHDAYREVTLFDVARHRAGIVGHSDDIAVAIERYAELPGSPTEQRALYLSDVLQLPPAVERGRMHYSNAGFCVLAHICERALGKSYEDAIEDFIFSALGFRTGGFGWPAHASQPDGIWGHGEDEAGVLGPFEEDLVLGAFLAPAGDMHLPIGDFAELVLQHALGPRGESRIADADAFSAIHRDYPGAKGGAGVGKRRVMGVPGLGHVGSTGVHWSRFVVFPSIGLSVAVATNAPVETLEERAVTAAFRAIVQNEIESH